MIYVQLPDRTKFENDCLRERNEQLRTMISNIDLQAVGQEMSLKIGENISGKILEYIKKLKEQIG